MVGSRMRSGASLLASTRGVSLMRFANWSCLMSHLTLGYCFVNSSLSLNGRSNPVSKYAFKVTGELPQPAVPPDADPDDEPDPAPGAHAATRATAMKVVSLRNPAIRRPSQRDKDAVQTTFLIGALLIALAFDASVGTGEPMTGLRFLKPVSRDASMNGRTCQTLIRCWRETDFKTGRRCG